MSQISTVCVETTQNFMFNVLFFGFSSTEMPFNEREKTFSHLTELRIVSAHAVQIWYRFNVS